MATCEMKVAVRKARKGGMLMSSTNSESTRPKYEPPCAVRLSDAASGLTAENCVPGSQASGYCQSGLQPYGNCSGGSGVGFFRRQSQAPSGH